MNLIVGYEYPLLNRERCCEEAALVKDVFLSRDGITFMVCPICHKTFTTTKESSDLRCILHGTPPQNIERLFGKEALTEQERLDLQ